MKIEKRTCREQFTQQNRCTALQRSTTPINVTDSEHYRVNVGKQRFPPMPLFVLKNLPALAFANLLRILALRFEHHLLLQSIPKCNSSRDSRCGRSDSDFKGTHTEDGKKQCPCGRRRISTSESSLCAEETSALTGGLLSKAITLARHNVHLPRGI